MDLEGLYQRVCEWWSSLDELERTTRLVCFAPKFAYHSVRIEDKHATPELAREAFESDSVTAYTGPLSTLCEIKGQKDSFARMLGDLRRARAFDESLVLETHEDLTWGTYNARQLADGERPGTWRLGDYLVPGANEVGAPAEDVPGLVHDLCAEVNDVIEGATPKRALTTASYFHAAFETIHPFSDGSGLCGRELMNHILLRGGHPPVIVFFEDKNAYYEALDAFNRQGDLDPFRRLVMAEAIKTWRERAGL